MSLTPLIVAGSYERFLFGFQAPGASSRDTEERVRGAGRYLKS